ncbi:hypothetical protein K523DRAFT_367611 [Schizophyllum commune Tattone D]|nr:hypothetical protein K523DRAFT_367611 [Schizophyllum commune Tattone D]
MLPCLSHILSLTLLVHLFVRVARSLPLDAFVVLFLPPAGPALAHLHPSRRRVHRPHYTMYNASELWLTYQLASRIHSPPTTQLIDLALSPRTMHDLEDVLDYVFRQGYIEAKYRSSTYWERADGTPVKASESIEGVMTMGVGMTPENPLKLVVDDAPTALWFSYHHLDQPSAKTVAQRVRLTEAPHIRRLAHVTNYVFQEGYLPPHVRPFVYWQGICGRRIEDHIPVEDLLKWGEGINEDKALKLVVDNRPAGMRTPEPTIQIPHRVGTPMLKTSHSSPTMKSPCSHPSGYCL